MLIPRTLSWGVLTVRGRIKLHQSPKAMKQGEHLCFRLSGLRERDGLFTSKYTEA